MEFFAQNLIGVFSGRTVNADYFCTPLWSTFLASARLNKLFLLSLYAGVRPITVLSVHNSPASR